MVVAGLDSIHNAGRRLHCTKPIIPLTIAGSSHQSKHLGLEVSDGKFMSEFFSAECCLRDPIISQFRRLGYIRKPIRPIFA
jgi:hypothetical protein